MKKEESYYIQILNDFVNGKASTMVEALDWECLMNLAYSQNTNGILYFQCKSFIPEPYNRYLNNLFLNELSSYGKRIRLNKDIEDKFRESGINYCLIKGMIVAKYYPVPALRTMGDSDFLIQKLDYPKAFSLLEELGLVCKDAFDGAVFYDDKLCVEIHDHLLYENDGGSDKQIEYCEKVWDYVRDGVLDLNYHFIFLLLHIRKHIVNQGIGFRFFVDLAVMMQKEKLDWTFINQELAKIEMLRFKDVCLALINQWFGIKGEENLIELDASFIEEASLKILYNGVYGFDDQSNNLNVAYQKISGPGTKAKYFLNRYFRDYDSLIKDKNYKFLIGRKYLLPLAWLYRFYLSIRDNKALREIKKSFNSLHISQNELNERDDELKRWGL